MAHARYIESRFRSLLQNIVSFIGLFLQKRPMSMNLIAHARCHRLYSDVCIPSVFCISPHCNTQIHAFSDSIAHGHCHCLYFDVCIPSAFCISPRCNTQIHANNDLIAYAYVTRYPYATYLYVMELHMNFWEIRVPDIRMYMELYVCNEISICQISVCHGASYIGLFLQKRPMSVAKEI